jgi:hypothetical protein
LRKIGEKRGGARRGGCWEMMDGMGRGEEERDEDEGGGRREEVGGRRGGKGVMNSNQDDAS